MKFWIRINGLQEGPMDLEQLKAQKITPTTYVWCAGMKDWAYARDVTDLQDIIAQNSNSEEPGYNNPEQTSIVEADTTNEPEQLNDTETPASASDTDSQPEQVINRPAVQPATTFNEPQKEDKPKEERPCPPNNLIWAILITIFCCQPIGIVAIILAAQVSNKYYDSGYEAAKKYSDWTAILCIACIVLAILSMSIFTPLMFLMAI